MTPLDLLMVGTLLAGAPSGGQSPDATLHGEFTGEVKPVVYVSDVERSVPFYRDVLGFGFGGLAGDEDDPYYADMLAGPLEFGLHEPTMEGDAGRVGQIRLYFRVRSLEAHRRRVTARGGDPGEIVRRSWMDYFVVRDPDGNAIVFAVTDPARHTSDPWTTDAAAGAGDSPSRGGPE